MVSAHKANIHVKLISGIYILQKNEARFNQYDVNSLCPLCGNEPEDLMHFMLTCEKLDEARSCRSCLRFIVEVTGGLGMTTGIWSS